jgi:hypothetical protein
MAGLCGIEKNRAKLGNLKKRIYADRKVKMIGYRKDKVWGGIEKRLNSKTKRKRGVKQKEVNQDKDIKRKER